MIVLSLFDGISCGQVALERAGFQVNKYYSSEIDKYAIQVTQKNYPGTIQLGDIRGWRGWNIPTPDIILAGSPCQGFSFAGKQLNFDDPRSALFFEFVDIWKHYKKINPNIKFLLENTLMSKESIRVITGIMNVEPMQLNSSLVSGQVRKRLYWSNISVNYLPKDRGIFLKDILESGLVDRDKSHCLDANYFKGASLQYYLRKKRRQVVFVDKDSPYLIRKLTPIECERLQTLPDNYTEGVSNTQRYKALGNGWTVDIIVHILKHWR